MPAGDGKYDSLISKCEKLIDKYIKATFSSDEFKEEWEAYRIAMLKEYKRHIAIGVNLTMEITRAVDGDQEEEVDEKEEVREKKAERSPVGIRFDIDMKDDAKFLESLKMGSGSTLEVDLQELEAELRKARGESIVAGQKQITDGKDSASTQEPLLNDNRSLDQIEESILSKAKGLSSIERGLLAGAINRARPFQLLEINFSKDQKLDDDRPWSRKINNIVDFIRELPADDENNVRLFLLLLEGAITQVKGW